jgi:hypothetical protein
VLRARLPKAGSGGRETTENALVVSVATGIVVTCDTFCSESVATEQTEWFIACDQLRSEYVATAAE